MKRLIIVLTFILTCVFSINSANAVENSLNTILLEKTDGNYNIVLRADNQLKVIKKVKNSNNIELIVKDITASQNVPILYRNVPDDSSLIIESDGEDGIKIDVQAPKISNTNIVIETPNSAPVTVNTNYTLYMILAAIGAIMALFYANKVSKRKSQKVAFDLNIKDREMKLLRKYRDELTTLPSINYDITKRRYAHNMLRQRETRRKVLR